MRTMTLYTLPEVATLLECPEWKIRYLINQGYFVPKPELCKSRVFLFDDDDVQKLKVELNQPRRKKRTRSGLLERFKGEGKAQPAEKPAKRRRKRSAPGKR